MRISTILRWIRHPFRRLRSYLKNAGRKELVKFLSAYLGSALAGTYLVTALLTPASLTDPVRVIGIAERCGVINVATGGLGAPVVSLAKQGLGSLTGTIGRALKDDALASWGDAVNLDGSDFFKTGLGVYADPSSMGDTGTDADGMDISDATDADASPTPTDSVPAPPSPLDAVRGFLFGTGSTNPAVSSAYDDAASSGGPSAQDGAATQSDDATAAAAEGRLWTQWDPQLYPDYYRIIPRPVTPDRDVEVGTVVYDGYDRLGRTRRVIGNVTYDMVAESAGWRAGFSSDVRDISGWYANGVSNNARVSMRLPNGRTYNGYFWNRSHLLGDSLGGYDIVRDADGAIDQSQSKSSRHNLVCGTRMQNVGANDGKGGMQFFESTVTNYLREHPSCSVWYSADPVYEGDELVPRSVIVQAVSCDGGLDIQGEVFNAADADGRYQINYATGQVTDTRTGRLIGDE